MPNKCRILFVDDEFRIIKLLNMMFRTQYEVYTAISGEEAIKLLEEHEIDIICSDQRMPGMLGIELLAIARERWPKAMRLLLTGYSDLVAMVGAINEGEVYRFINKPWNHEDLKATIAECAAIRQAADAAFPGPLTETTTESPLASATKLLALDGIAADRHEVMEMFTEDYNVVGASSPAEARDIIRKQDVGVIVTDSRVGGEDTLEFLRELKRENPFLTIVVLSSTADSDTIVKLINQAHIYRFAMKPISPNVFRLAVSAAMREHHRMLADPSLAVRHVKLDADLASDPDDPEMINNIVGSLARFTKIW
jgi:DNA-binding NtrC family response regulator